MTPSAAEISTPDAPHATDVARILREQETDLHRGLTHAEVEKRRRRHGHNVLKHAAPSRWWKRLARQFSDLMIWILLAAAVVSAVLGEWVDATVIFVIVGLNGILGFIQEEKAARALASLRRLAAPRAKTLRAGEMISIPASELVPGDRVELEAGDHVPADVRLVHSAGFRAHEAALTGESTPVDKNHVAVLEHETPLAERVNMAYMGTSATAGSASGVVVATGMSTQIGQIAGLLQVQKSEPTPLQTRLAELGRMLIWIVLVIVALIFVLNLLRGGSVVAAFLLSVSLAVAAVPEGMPAVVTISLALGLQRMAQRKALVRRLPSVETLGAVTVICSDKTGTLTRNEMTVREIVAGGRWFDVTGSGYQPDGSFEIRSGELATTEPADPMTQPDLLRALEIAARCNHASLNQASDGSWKVVGDPTEGALLVAARKAGIEFDLQQGWIDENPFDSDRKMMSVIVESASGIMLCSKGAPEVILRCCSTELCNAKSQPLEEGRRQKILDAANSMASRAMRVLALAYRETGSSDDVSEENLIFAGLIGMIDPPRDEARAAVQRCRTAGIQPVMITGDHPSTALAIARELGIAGERDRAVSGIELDRMSDEQLKSEIEELSVYARVTAAHKLRVISAWRAQGQIVAMTGDGVNDAPAVKAADIGVAMGVTGTDVTKDVSDMVLMDDNFASIVNAVEEGRTIFDNIRKFIHYLLATNTGEVLLMFVCALIGLPAPLIAIQVLWINLVTDALPALALGVEVSEPDVMSRKPRAAREPLVSATRGIQMLYHGSLIAGVSLVAFIIVQRADPAHAARAQTVAFCTLAYAQLLFSFACRSERFTMPELGPFSNPWLIGAMIASVVLQTAVVTLPFAEQIFKVQTPSAVDWIMIGLFALTPVTIVESTKLLRASLRRRRSAAST